MLNLTVKDLEILQGTLNQAGLNYQLKFQKMSSYKMTETFACSPISASGVSPCPTLSNQFFQQALYKSIAVGG
ncbi:hypothetical protein [Okeania sp. SIO3I5]|uniref:hypothetical protein n=1 Tax=Okeania sp. SIO3I5 TaxID=2607805 RepID=UPI0025CE3A24|nr:hypothetical protein [Okeania sp. SIO3I5]